MWPAVLAVVACALLGGPATALAADPPSIESTSVSGLTETDGVLEADIDTGGLDTNYQFRLFYGCGFGFEACPLYCISGQSCHGPWNSVVYVPLPSGDLPASTDVQHVSLDLNSVGVTLQPYKYRYSVAATNTAGTVEGPDQFFTPPSSPPPSDDGPPSIGSQWTTNVTETDATLNAYLDPNGSLTKYKLQVDTTGNFEFDQNDSCVLHPPGVYCTQEMITGDPLPPGLVEPPESTLPAGDEVQQVSVNLASIGAVLQPGTTYHFRLIASNGGSDVEGFEQTFTTPSGGTGPPAIVSQSATSVTHDDATLNAVINPNGRDTVYKLQIDTTGNFRFYQTDSCALHAPNTGCATVIVPGDPLPAGLVEPPESSLPAGTENQHVSVDLADIGAVLQPGTTYHYRAIAANSDQLVAGPDQTFTTPAEGEPVPVTGPPVVDSQSVSNVTSTNATLNAVINPNGRTTAYKLQIDTTGNFKFFQNDGCPLHPPGIGCTQATVPGDPLPVGLVEPSELSLPAGTENQHVSVDLASIGAVLQPNTTYHYRAIAANGASTEDGDWVIAGPDQTFTTPSPDATLPGQPPAGSTAPASLPAVNPAPSVSHPRRGKHKRHGHRRHKRSARSTRAVRR